MSLYDLKGRHFWTDPSAAGRLLGMDRFDQYRAAKDECPSVTFSFADFDGENLTATTQIEDREWRFGEGWFKWLSWFRQPKIRRSLDINFSSGTGPRKGSWKGGTTGHGIDLLPGELHESAFRRYCAAHDMTFLNAVMNPAKEPPNTPPEPAAVSDGDARTS